LPLVGGADELPVSIEHDGNWYTLFKAHTKFSRNFGILIEFANVYVDKKKQVVSVILDFLTFEYPVQITAILTPVGTESHHQEFLFFKRTHTCLVYKQPGIRTFIVWRIAVAGKGYP